MPFWERLFIRFVRDYRVSLSVLVYAFFPSDFEDDLRDLIALVPDHRPTFLLLLFSFPFGVQGPVVQN